MTLLLTFVLSIYLLVYARPIGELVRKLLPPGDGTPADDYPLLVPARGSPATCAGQLMFSLIMGGSAGVIMVLFRLDRDLP